MINLQEVREEILSVLKMQAYDRGHSAGEKEVENILEDLKHDFKRVLLWLESDNAD